MTAWVKRRKRRQSVAENSFKDFGMRVKRAPCVRRATGRGEYTASFAQTMDKAAAIRGDENHIENRNSAERSRPR